MVVIAMLFMFMMFNLAFGDEEPIHRTVEVTDKKGVVTKTEYDVVSNLISVIEAKNTADEAVVNYDYDALGSLIKIKNPENHITTNEYNTLGQIVKEKHPDTGATEFNYDLNGNLIETVDALGRTIKMDYDSLSRISSIDYDDDNILEVEYFYDNECGNADIINSWGRICKIIDLSGTIEFVYDERGRTICETKTVDEIGYVTDYSYDSLGNVDSVTYPSGKRIVYSYNTFKQLESVALDSDNDGNIDEKVIKEYSYNPSGTINRIVYGNGITTEYDYTKLDWLNKIDSGSDVLQRSYSYDITGNVEYIYDDINHISAIAQFNYDKLDRLVNVYSNELGDETYTYDKVGNRKTLVESSSNKVYKYDYEETGSHSIKLKKIETTASPTVTSNLEYDAVGNLISDENYKYYYDYENRLIKVTLPDDTVVEEYIYDYLGNRIKKISKDKTTLYLYDLSSTLIEERVTKVFSPSDFNYSNNFIIQDRDENYLMIIDKTGTVMIKGNLFENSEATPDSDDFKIQDNAGNTFAWLSNPEGDLYLKGQLFKESEQEPQTGIKEFIIQSNNMTNVVFFDETGNLYTKGWLAENIDIAFENAMWELENS